MPNDNKPRIRRGRLIVAFTPADGRAAIKAAAALAPVTDIRTREVTR